MNPSDFSVVIPALNEADNISQCVESAVGAGAGETIVVDGGSQDATIQLATDNGATVVSCEPGRAKQLNFGAAQAHGSAILFLHADNWLGTSAIQQAAEALQDASCHWGAFRQKIEANGLTYRWLEKGNASRVTRWGVPYGDQGIFIRRKLFDSVGRFPDEPLMEDLILSRRLRRESHPVLLDGPLYISSRRWQRHGVLRQTIRNFTLRFAFALGTSPSQLRKFYPNHAATN